jgi:hypothetical protein
MSSLTFHQNIVQKFRESYLSAVPPVIERASSVSLAQRWDVLFQYSTQPKSELINPDVQTMLMDLYQVVTLGDLSPQYIGEGERWGAIISLRIGTWARKRVACIDHWFVTNPADLLTMLDRVKAEWHLPCDAIQLPISPNHRSVSFLAEIPQACLEECVYAADWSATRPPLLSSKVFKEFSFFHNQVLDAWWSDFCCLLEPEPLGSEPENEKSQLQKGMERSLHSGGILNVYDHQGLAGHVSWYRGSDAELLIPQCWQIHYIVVRPNLRGQKVAQYLYALAARRMNVDHVSLVSARMQGANVHSRKAFEAVGAENILETYTFQSDS